MQNYEILRAWQQARATLLQQSSIWYKSFNTVNIYFLFSSKKREQSAEVLKQEICLRDPEIPTGKIDYGC